MARSVVVSLARDKEEYKGNPSEEPSPGSKIGAFLRHAKERKRGLPSKMQIIIKIMILVWDKH